MSRFFVLSSSRIFASFGMTWSSTKARTRDAQIRELRRKVEADHGGQDSAGNAALRVLASARWRSLHRLRPAPRKRPPRRTSRRRGARPPRRWLGENVPGCRGGTATVARQFKGGQSNPTYWVGVEGGEGGDARARPPQEAARASSSPRRTRSSASTASCARSAARASPSRRRSGSARTRASSARRSSS